MQMNLESVTQSKVSQKEKKRHIYIYIYIYIYINAYIWNLEKCTKKSICRAGIDAGVESRLVGTSGEGEGGVSWESSRCEMRSWWESAV